MSSAGDAVPHHEVTHLVDEVERIDPVGCAFDHGRELAQRVAEVGTDGRGQVVELLGLADRTQGLRDLLQVLAPRRAPPPRIQLRVLPASACGPPPGALTLTRFGFDVQAYAHIRVDAKHQHRR